MELITTAAELSRSLDDHRRASRSVGLVPTLGGLHAGHAALIAQAAADCDVVVVSVFLNPLQFAPGEDLASYPRTLDADVELVVAAGGSIVFAPSTEEMYGGEGTLTTVHVEGLTATLEGASRPTHFDGVATVVAKLFAVTGRCRAYFGEKDFQQLAVVRRIATDLSFPVDVVACPTVREADGLALSTRNQRLSPAERQAAPVLHRALQAGADAVLAGAQQAAVVRDAMERVLEKEPLVAVDYAVVVGADTLTVSEPLTGELRLLVAARLASTRLIDNLGVTVPTASTTERPV